MKNIFSILTIIIILFSLNLFSQDSDDGEFNFIRSETGVRILYNVTGCHFYFDLPCKFFNEIDANDMVFVFDDVLIQITPVPISAFAKTPLSSMNDSMALVMHQIYEMKNIRAQYKGKFNINYSMWTDTNKRLCNSWEFNVPGVERDTSSQIIVHQKFASTRIGDRVLMLSCALTNNTDVDGVKKKITSAFLSIFQNEEQIDSEELRKRMLTE